MFKKEDNFMKGNAMIVFAHRISIKENEIMSS